MTEHGVETHWLSSKENVLGTAISRQSDADSSDMKGSSLLISLKKVQL